VSFEVGLIFVMELRQWVIDCIEKVFDGFSVQFGNCDRKVMSVIGLEMDYCL